MDYQNDPNAVKLYAFLSQWARNHPTWAYEPNGWMMTLKSVESVTRDLMSEAKFDEINLAGVIRSPDAQLIETVVTWVLPWPTSLEFKLLVDAITAAAKAKQKNQRGVAAGWTLAVGVLLFAVFSSD